MSGKLSFDEHPIKLPLGDSLALEPYDLAPPHRVSGSLLERNRSLMLKILAGDLLRAFDTVPLATTTTNGLQFSITIRDDIRIALTSSTDQFGIAHNKNTPKDAGDSARVN
jgi:hypothetical protein